jgi:hypothetical protein
MKLTLRCQYCSECKEVECDDTHSASRRCEIARENGWTAFRLNGYGIPLYFCRAECEQRYRVQTKTHLKIVGSVNR